MAKYNYESLKNSQQEKTTSNTQSTARKEYPRVGYFNLWDEKPSAIVRFDVGSSDDLEILDVHNTKITRDDGTHVYRYVACLRNNDEPFKVCPLCAKDVKTRRTIVFVKMLEYRLGEDGKVNVVPVTWARASTFADELVSLINDYGDLRELLFKVSIDKSTGKTKYNVRLQPEMGIYTEAAGYVKDFSAFNNFMMNKHSYMERTFDELEEFVNTGVMASRKPKSEQQESKNLETLISDDAEEKEAEATLDPKPAPAPKYDDAPSVVEAPVPTDDELPFKFNETHTQPKQNTTNIQVNDDNPTTSRRRRYDFSDQDTFTNPF